MSTLYHRALGLSAVVLVAAVAALVLAVASAAADRQHRGALGVHRAIDEAGGAVAELRRTRDPAWGDSAAAALDRAAAAADALPAADAARVGRSVAAYAASVGRLRRALRARGLDERSGAEGAFRERVHAVEARVEGEDPALLLPVLQARRREKDYLLRGDPAYVADVRRHVAEAVAAARTLPAARADSVRALLGAYEAGFLDLVRWSAAVEWEAGRIEREAAVTRRVTGPVEASAARRSGWLGGFALAAALLSACVVGAGVLYQARGITRPVGRLRDAAARLARGETGVRVAVEGPDEVRTLAAALNAVADYAERTATAERRLVETERFLSTVLGQAQEGVVALDREGRIAYANPYAEALYETPLDAARGRRPDEAFSSLWAEWQREGVARALAGEVVPPADHEMRIGERAGWVQVTYAPLVDDGGEVRGVVATFHDVTDRVETERALRAAKEAAEAADRLKSAFLANMSHEIRTPLTGIIGYADLLAVEVDPGAADLVEVIQRGGHRLLETLNSVLDLAQLESGTMEVRRERVDLSRAALETAELFAPASAQAGLSLTTDVAPGVVVATDRRALARVLSNLVSNAVKFTSEGGVALRVGAEGGAAVVEVADTGIGMDPAFQARMFDEFQQASEGHARAYEGNGLGLTIVRRLSDLMGAGLDVESARGEGTTVRLRLPLGRRPAPEARATRPATA